MIKPDLEHMKDILYAAIFVGVVVFVLHTVFHFSVQVLRNADILYNVEEMEANKLNPRRADREILIDIEERIKEMQLLHVPKDAP